MDLKICFICAGECESDERYKDLVRCDCCKAEDLNMPDDRYEYLFERDLRNGVA